MNASSTEQMSAGATAPPVPARAGYIALARRCRPLAFDDVIGQDHVTRTLKNALASQRVHHAYLFTGTRGVGKTTVARILARALNDDGGPAPAAVAGELEAAIDLIEIDGASHTGVDDVRQLRENARYLPAQGKRKIYIIDEVHMLSTSAFNALLKTLEEPPAHVTFIFATTEPHKIPATILSRCQRFDFRRVPMAQLLAHLQRLVADENVAFEEGGLTLIARAAEGSVRDALTLLDQVLAYAAEESAISASRVAEILGIADRRVFFDLSQAVLARDAATALQTVAQVFASGYDLAHFSGQFLAHLRDLVVVKTCAQPAPLLDVSEAELAELRRQGEAIAASLLQQQFEHFARVADDLARSTFPRLLLEMALVEMAHAEPLQPLGDLLERLEQLEARLGGGVASTSALPPAQTLAPAPARPAADTAPRPRVSPARVGASRQATTPAETKPRQAKRGKGTDAAARAEEAEQQLTAFRALLEQLDPVLTSPYVAGQLLRWVGGTIELGYAQGSFELTRAADPQKREAFQHACSVALGKDLQVKISALKRGETPPEDVRQLSALQARDQERAQRRRQLEDEAREHPTTKAVIERFGAQISRIKTVADGDE